MLLLSFLAYILPVALLFQTMASYIKLTLYFLWQSLLKKIKNLTDGATLKKQQVGNKSAHDFSPHFPQELPHMELDKLNKIA